MNPIIGDRNGRALRETWIVRVSATEVLDAARAKMRWHYARHGYWKQERERLLGEAGTRGIVLEESNLEDVMEAAKMLSANIGGTYSAPRHHAGPTLDPKYARELTTADRKMVEHAQAARTLRDWVLTLEEMLSTQELNLEHEDRRFFGIGLVYDANEEAVDPTEEHAETE
jgi:hypothetical protein